MSSATDNAPEPEPLLTPLELVARYQQAVPQLTLACIEAKRGIERALENVQDIRMRDALRQQALVWDVQAHTLGMQMVLLQMVADIHSAVGVDITRQ